MQNNPFQTRPPSINGNPRIRIAITQRDITKLQGLAKQLTAGTAQGTHG
mgnify:CR=1 FL=1